MFTANVFPMAELKTARLLLRSHLEQDVEPTVAMFTDDLSMRWLMGPQPYTEVHGRAWCTQAAHTMRTLGTGINWAITDLETGRYIGGIGLKNTDWESRVTEVGYAVGAWARGRGFAPEATRAAAEWALRDQKMNRVTLFAAVGNAASQRVAEKAGFVREGVARHAGFTHHGQEDMVMFSLIPADLGKPGG